MSDLSNYLEDALINHILRNTAYASPGTNVWISLYTTNPDEDDSGTEVSGGSYAREQLSGTGDWDAPSNGATANTADLTFTQATASWGEVTHVAIHDASSAGNLLFYGALSVSKTVDNGDTFKFNAGDLDVSLA